MNLLLQIIAAHFGISTSEILLKRGQRGYKEKPLKDIRYMTASIIRDNGYTFDQIGDFFDRDHTTVIFLCEQHRNMMFSSPIYVEKYQNLIKAIRLNLNIQEVEVGEKNKAPNDIKVTCFEWLEKHKGMVLTPTLIDQFKELKIWSNDK